MIFLWVLILEALCHRDIIPKRFTGHLFGPVSSMPVLWEHKVSPVRLQSRKNLHDVSWIKANILHKLWLSWFQLSRRAWDLWGRHPFSSDQLWAWLQDARQYSNMDLTHSSTAKWLSFTCSVLCNVITELLTFLINNKEYPTLITCQSL